MPDTGERPDALNLRVTNLEDTVTEILDRLDMFNKRIDYVYDSSQRRDLDRDEFRKRLHQLERVNKLEKILSSMDEGQ